MASYNQTTCIYREIDDKEVEITVDYNYSPATPPCGWYDPGDPGEIDIISATDDDGNKYELTEKEEQEIFEEGYTGPTYEDYMEERYG